jgi:hypothetical protein
MTHLYTSQELSQILAQEQHACLRGERLNLTPATTRINPVVDPFLNLEGLQKFRAFCDFRDAVHDYQRQHQVSGLVWRTFTVQDQSICYPEIDDHLIALEQDLAVLSAHKPLIVKFWQQTTQNLQPYQQMGKHQPHQLITAQQIDYLAQRSEWAYLHKLDYPGALEITLQLGWGSPKDALYQKYWPHSGCYFIHAVASGQVPQSAYY